MNLEDEMMTTLYENWDISEIITDCLTNQNPAITVHGVRFEEYDKEKHGLIINIPLQAQHLIVAECVLFHQYNCLVEERDKAVNDSHEYFRLDFLSEMKYGYYQTVSSLLDSLLNVVLISRNIVIPNDDLESVILDQQTFTHLKPIQHCPKNNLTKAQSEAEKKISTIQVPIRKDLH